MPAVTRRVRCSVALSPRGETGFRRYDADESLRYCFAVQGMMGTTLIAFDGEPSMIFELTAR